MSKKRVPPDQCREILDSIKTILAETTGPVTIGLDMAAQVAEWGLCLLVLGDDLRTARLATTLPQAKINANRSRSTRYLFRPTLEMIDAVLTCARHNKRTSSLAVDVPFGWPCEQ